MRKPPEVDTPPIATNNRFSALDSRHEHHRGFDRPAPVGVQNNHNQKEILQSVLQDVESAEVGNQWVFSSYAPLKEGDNCPGFDDISPEEQRFQAYLSTKEGTVLNFTQLLEQIKADLARKRKLLKHPSPEIISCLMKLFQRIKVTDPPSALIQSTSNFGSIATASNFQSPPNQEYLQMQLSMSTSASNAPLFGKTNPASNQNVLGSQPSGTNNTQPPTSFGGGSSGNAFGSVTSSLGNSSSFANPVAADAFSFRVTTQGSTNSNVTTTRPSLFGGSTIPLAIPSNGQSMFEGSAGSTSMPVNSHMQQPTQGTFFGGSSVSHSAPTAGLFGKSVSNTSSHEAAASSLFGKKVSEESSSVGVGLDTMLPPSSVYTPLDELNEMEKSQFLADTFTLGKIPERPPPKELCV